MGAEFGLCKMKCVLQAAGGDGSTTISMHLMLLDHLKVVKMVHCMPYNFHHNFIKVLCAIRMHFHFNKSACVL